MIYYTQMEPLNGNYLIIRQCNLKHLQYENMITCKKKFYKKRYNKFESFNFLTLSVIQIIFSTATLQRSDFCFCAFLNQRILWLFIGIAFLMKWVVKSLSISPQQPNEKQGIIRRPDKTVFKKISSGAICVTNFLQMVQVRLVIVLSCELICHLAD